MGGGNLGVGFAVRLSQLGIPVHLFSRRDLVYSQSLRIRCVSEVMPSGTFTIASCSKRLPDPLPSRVIIACRNEDLQAYAQILASYFYRGAEQTHILLVTSGPFDYLFFRKFLLDNGVNSAHLPNIGGLPLSPINAKLQSDGSVRIKRFKKLLPIACTGNIGRFTEAFSDAQLNLYPAQSALSVALQCDGAFVHLPLFRSLAKRLAEGRLCDLYLDPPDFAFQFMQRLDRERCDIAVSLGIYDLPELSTAYRYHYDLSNSIREQIQAAHGSVLLNRVDSRVGWEEVPTLLMFAGLARIAQIQTPLLDELIKWALDLYQEPHYQALFKQFSLETLGLAHLSLEELRTALS